MLNCAVLVSWKASPRSSASIRSVILMCAHNEEGALGLIVNKLIDQITLPDLMKQLGIDAGGLSARSRVHFGGPVECGRGFVLHSADYVERGTLVVGESMAPGS